MQVLPICCYIKMDSSQWGKLKSSILCWVSFYSALTVNIYTCIYNCFCGIVYFKLNGIRCDKQNCRTWNYFMKGHHL